MSRKWHRMAIFHCQIKMVSRSEGRSAVAAAAYRSGARLQCEREGRVHDYCARSGVEGSFIVAPEDAPEWAREREILWNEVEAAETRSNARVAREWEIALPSELSKSERYELTAAYARALSERYSIVVDVAIHAPSRDGDSRNHHAHLLASTRKISRAGFTEKARILDDRKTGPLEIEKSRAMWAEIQNRALEQSGCSDRVDHRSLEAQRKDAQEQGQQQLAAELDRAPEVHLGSTVAALERSEQERARKDGREYVPVTERGKNVYEIREAKRNLLERLNAVKERYSQSREQGKSILESLRDSIRQTDAREDKQPERKTALEMMREQRAREDHERRERQQMLDRNKSDRDR